MDTNTFGKTNRRLWEEEQVVERSGKTKSENKQQQNANKTKQNKTKQNKTKQNKTKQNKTNKTNKTNKNHKQKTQTKNANKQNEATTTLFRTGLLMLLDTRTPQPQTKKYERMNI